ncbi:hypothetical protein YSY43_17540 [Paenibacillus sp. YSY-4.3]
MKKFSISALLLSVAFSILCLPMSVAAENSNFPSTIPSVTIEALNNKGESVEGFLTLRVISGGESKVIYNGSLNSDGKYSFNSTAPEQLETAGDVFDVVYEAIVSSPDGEFAVEHFAVSHVKNGAINSFSAKANLNEEQIVSIAFSGENNANSYSTPSSQFSTNAAISNWGPNCTGDPIGNYNCVDQEVYYTRPTKIGTVNVSSGETVTFSLSSSARVSIQKGVKASPSSSWSSNGSLTLATDSGTTVEYTIPGQCQIFWGSTECNLQRDIYANYQYRYSKVSFYNQFGYAFTEYYVVPTNVVGPSPQQGNEWVYNSSNGYSVASAKNQPQWFTVYSGASNTKSYGSERTFSAGFDVSTPVGSFGGSVTTAYKNAHSIKWSTTQSNTTFYHYSLDSSGTMFYVTK